MAPELKERTGPELHGMQVDFTWIGKIRDLRPSGAAAPVKVKRVDPGKFINPYTFLPATPRDTADKDLGDHAPAGHDRLHKDRWTGRLHVRLTVATPLLLLDPSRAERDGKDGHATYPVLRRNGEAYLPATSIRGMLRSAYEAVTNSRLGVFNGHQDRLAHRMTAAESQRMVPARISDDGTTITLLLGDTVLGGQASGKGAPTLHAAWLPRYKSQTVAYPDGAKPQHGHEVVARVERVHHARRLPGFYFWQVRQIARLGEELPATPEAPPGRTSGSSAHRPTGEFKEIRGWVCVTNQNISRKHDERVFFAGDAGTAEYPLTGELIQQWGNTIRDYRAVHRDDEIHNRMNRAGKRARPDEYLGHAPGATAWSPHQYDDSYLSLAPKTLCYAHIAEDGRTISGLYPVMISRSLFAQSPQDLLDDTLRPATTLDQLSPADRVFGWVSPSGPGAHRGQLRIGPVKCEETVQVDSFGDGGVPLAILGQPKPQQGRFYLADTSDGGQPLKARADRSTWYTPRQALRGRKAYWPHRGLPADYWDNPGEDRSRKADGSGRFREYRRPDDANGPQRDKQNRSVLGWIRPGSSFTFTIGVTNLTDIELGALVWLLSLPEQHHHRLGYGKPLGFGSVRLEVADDQGYDLRTGQQWTGAYRSLDPAADQAPEDIRTRLEQARRAFEAAVGGQAQAPHLQAFLAVSEGRVEAAVHYPRVRPAEVAENLPVKPDPEGNSYAWFVANEQEEKREIRKDRGLFLPQWDNPFLPILPEKPSR
ncbi:TIGR03986 family CRISPR-associated RAMP protein [Streptomyces sp900105755]|uniref:TIGR03986 family CRISPR-associated RAMP protein n=1 Tax=Streptomyces sp. 900105755 TaxID=3154389 RepID=A0ABV1TWL6_9ACTN